MTIASKPGSPGKRVPPVKHRFKKGQSGNPAGRPRGSKNRSETRLPFFEQRVPIMRRGKRCYITRAEYLVDFARKLAIGEQDGVVGDWLLSYKETVDRFDEKTNTAVVELYDSWSRSGSVTCLDDALRHLDIVRVLHRFCKTARMRLNPWIVSRALARMESERPSREQQARILDATRSAWRVEWPDWWEPDLRGKKRQSPRREK